jgi:hypothetical protein
MSTGAEPPEDDPNDRRNQDRDTEPIPRARPGSRPESRADYTASGEPPIEYSPTSDYEAVRDYEAAHSGGGGEAPHADYTTDGDEYVSDPYADPMTDGAHARGSAAPQYGGAPPSFSQDEFARLQGGDAVPSVPPGSRMAPLEDEASRHAARYLCPPDKCRG